LETETATMDTSLPFHLCPLPLLPGVKRGRRAGRCTSVSTGGSWCQATAVAKIPDAHAKSARVEEAREEAGAHDLPCPRESPMVQMMEKVFLCLLMLLMLLLVNSVNVRRFLR
jgi:hypothetical protein